MKLVEACLSARKDRESSFHLWGGAVKVVQSCLSARRHRESSFQQWGGAVKFVLACLIAGKVRDRGSYRCSDTSDNRTLVHKD